MMKPQTLPDETDAIQALRIINAVAELHLAGNVVARILPALTDETEA